MRTKSKEELKEELARYTPPEGHRFPVTRRELLSAGFIQGMGFLFAPSAIQFLGAAKAQASGNLIPNMPAFLEINGSGGLAFFSHSQILDINRNPLPSYSQSGQSDNLSTTTVGSNGLQAYNNGGIVRAFNSVLGGNLPNNSILQKAAFFAMCSNTNSDTSSNMMSAAGLVQATVVQGAWLPSLQGGTGSSNQPAFLPPPAPINVSGFSSIQNAVGPQPNDTFSSIPKTAQTSILNFVQNLNSSHTARLASTKAGVPALNSILTQAAGNTVSLINGAPSTFDPRLNSTVANIWGINGGTQDNDINLINASVAYNLANGNTAAGCITLGGCDYHGQGRQTQDATDLTYWTIVAKCLQTFQALGKAVMINCSTDGQIAGATTSQTQWTGDNNSNAVNYLIAYDPVNGVTPIKNANSGKLETQIGQFTSSQSSDLSNPVASASGLASAVFINYIAMAKQMTNPLNNINLTGLATNVQTQLQVISG